MPFLSFIALNTLKQASHQTLKSFNSTKCSKSTYSFCTNLQNDIFTSTLEDAHEKTQSQQLQMQSLKANLSLTPRNMIPREMTRRSKMKLAFNFRSADESVYISFF